MSEPYILGSQSPGGEWHFVFITFQRVLFLIAVAIAAWRFGVKGGLAACLAMGLVALPYIIVEVVIPFRPGFLAGIVVISVVGVMFSWLIASHVEKRMLLQKAHDQLETRVQERTAQLSEVNEQLEQELYRRKQVENELEEYQHRLKKLLAKVISAQEDERKRIARELHDEAGQALTSLMVGLKFIEDSASATQIREKIAELRGLAVQTLDDMHHLATELRPSLLDDIGLVAAIQKYTREYSTKMNINIDSHVSGLSRQRLPSEIEVTVYRIVQEALTNIAKYAEAKNVSVVLRHRDSTLVVAVEDDGKGFDVNSVMASANGKKLGLFGMYERASLIRGNLTIESQPGAGTTIFLEVPLKLTKEVLDGQDKSASGR